MYNSCVLPRVRNLCSVEISMQCKCLDCSYDQWLKNKNYLCSVVIYSLLCVFSFKKRVKNKEQLPSTDIGQIYRATCMHDDQLCLKKSL